MTGRFPSQMASNAGNFYIWRCHHGIDQNYFNGTGAAVFFFQCQWIQPEKHEILIYMRYNLWNISSIRHVKVSGIKINDSEDDWLHHRYMCNKNAFTRPLLIESHVCCHPTTAELIYLIHINATDKQKVRHLNSEQTLKWVDHKPTFAATAPFY